MRNKEVCENFVKGNGKAKAKNLYAEHNILYSYGTHYPLCISLLDEKFNTVYLLNKTAYSNTTSRHRGHLINVLTGHYFKEFCKEKEKGNHKDILLFSCVEMCKIREFVIVKNIVMLDRLKEVMTIEKL